MKGLLKTILLVVLVAVLCVMAPWLTGLLFTLVGVTLPIVGVLMIVFLPIIVIGTIIGYIAGRKEK